MEELIKGFIEYINNESYYIVYSFQWETNGLMQCEIDTLVTDYINSLKKE